MTPTRDQIEEAVKYFKDVCEGEHKQGFNHSADILLSLADLYLRASEEMPEKKNIDPASARLDHERECYENGFDAAHDLFLPVVMRLKEEISRLKKFEETYLKASEEMPQPMGHLNSCASYKGVPVCTCGANTFYELHSKVVPIVMRLKARVEFLEKELENAKRTGEI